MKYLTLDTCVWLELIKIDLHNDNNVFEEICYWIENKHITHITPENIIREWDRNKLKKIREITNGIKSLHNTIVAPFKGTPELYSVYQPDNVEEIISKRIERVESLLKTYSEIALENQLIYNQAIKRNFDCLAPNHSEDSFRDTINIFTLIQHIKSKGYNECCFSTINFSDFSVSKEKKHDLHTHLENEFRDANLQYVFCDDTSIFGNKLFNVILRPKLPNFQDYLKEKKRKEEESEIITRSIEKTTIVHHDKDYLENLVYIDIIIAKERRTSIDEMLLGAIIKLHDSYKQYFLRNVGNNGMV